MRFCTTENLELPAEWDGRVELQGSGIPPMDAPHRHAELELNLVTAGRAAYLLGERRYDLSRGSLVWLFPGQDHVLLERSADHRMWIGVFKPRLLDRLEIASERTVLGERSPVGHFCRRVSGGVSARLAALLEGVCAQSKDPALFNAGLGYALLSAWAAYEAADTAVVGAEVHPAVEQAARLLQDDPDLFSVEAVAGRVGLSASHLSRLFHAQTGITLVEFRNRQRLRRFLSVYGAGNGVSALEAALETGFGSYPQFHRVFVRQMGCNLAEYRRGLRRTTTALPAAEATGPAAAGTADT